MKSSPSWKYHLILSPPLSKLFLVDVIIFSSTKSIFFVFLGLKGKSVCINILTNVFFTMNSSLNVNLKHTVVCMWCGVFWCCMLCGMLTEVWLAVDGQSVEDEVETGESHGSLSTSQSSVMSQSGPDTVTPPVTLYSRQSDRERPIIVS